MGRIPLDVHLRIANTQFQGLAGRPGAWRFSADRALAVAEFLVLPLIEVQNRARQQALNDRSASRAMTPQEVKDEYTASASSVWAMMIAVAAESFLKGVIMAREKPQVVDVLPRSLAHHDLVKLAARAAVSLTPDELKLLGELAEYGEWRGRYLVPKTRDKVMARTVAGEDTEPVLWLNPIEGAVAKVQPLLNLLRQALDDAVKPAP